MERFKKSLQFNLENQSKKIEQPSQSTIEKKYFGQRNQEDFDQVLSFDFQEHVRDNPPIKGVFSPEDELGKIKSLPREQKRKALANFKENLAKQRKELAACRVFIERSIEFNHDVPKKKLIGLVDKFSKSYGFTKEQKQIVEKLIDGYFAHRQAVLKFRQNNLDNNALVKKLTGITFNSGEKFDVRVGPMTIDIYTDGVSADRIRKGVSSDLIIFVFGGCAKVFNRFGKKPIFYIVINQDKWIREAFKDPTGEKTRRHEYEHQKNRLFRKVFEGQFDISPWKHPIRFAKFERRFEKEQDPEIKKIILSEFLAEKRADALGEAEDEITALLYNEDLPVLQKKLGDIFFSMTGSYDYLGYVRNRKFKAEKDNALFQKMSQKMLVQEYRAIIEKAVDSYRELVEKGYSIQEATALLTDKPLADWPKTIRRLLEQKN